MSATIEDKFWKTFESTLGRKFERQCQSASQLEEWDSLKHVELIFELEQRFDVEIAPEEIASLYSDTDSVIEFLKKQAQA